MLNSKIEELRNASTINQRNELMKELSLLDTGETLRRNVENIMIENQKEEERIKIMQQGNNVINSDLGLKNEDEYLKSILGSGTAGAPPAY